MISKKDLDLIISKVDCLCFLEGAMDFWGKFLLKKYKLLLQVWEFNLNIYHYSHYYLMIKILYSIEQCSSGNANDEMDVWFFTRTDKVRKEYVIGSLIMEQVVEKLKKNHCLGMDMSWEKKKCMWWEKGWKSFKIIFGNEEEDQRKEE